jgi:hypothetical protein
MSEGQPKSSEADLDGLTEPMVRGYVVARRASKPDDTLGVRQDPQAITCEPDASKQRLVPHTT